MHCVDMIIISGPQLWKLDGNTLLNKEGLWKSDDAWNFETKTKARNLIYIEDISKAKFLGITNDSKVLQNKEGLWIVESDVVDGELVRTIM